MKYTVAAAALASGALAQSGFQNVSTAYATVTSEVVSTSTYLATITSCTGTLAEHCNTSVGTVTEEVTLTVTSCPPESTVPAVTTAPVASSSAPAKVSDVTVEETTTVTVCTKEQCTESVVVNTSTSPAAVPSKPASSAPVAVESSKSVPPAETNAVVTETCTDSNVCGPTTIVTVVHGKTVTVVGSNPSSTAPAVVPVSSSNVTVPTGVAQSNGQAQLVAPLGALGAIAVGALLF